MTWWYVIYEIILSWTALFSYSYMLVVCFRNTTNKNTEKMYYAKIARNFDSI